MMQRTEGVLAVPDPDLEIRGGGGGGRSSRPLDSGERSPKKVFSALRASVWSKNKGGGPGPPGPSPRPATVWYMPQPISGGDALMHGFDFPHSQYPVC